MIGNLGIVWTLVLITLKRASDTEAAPVTQTPNSVREEREIEANPASLNVSHHLQHLPNRNLTSHPHSHFNLRYAYPSRKQKATLKNRVPFTELYISSLPGTTLPYVPRTVATIAPRPDSHFSKVITRHAFVRFSDGQQDHAPMRTRQSQLDEYPHRPISGQHFGL